MSNQSQKRKRNPQNSQDNSSGTNNNTVYQKSLIRPTSNASASSASASSASASNASASSPPVLRRAFSLVPSESAVPAPPLLRRTTRPHNTGAASAANASAANASAANGPIANIFNGNPRRNLRSSLKHARTTAVARRVTFPGFNNLSPPATPVNSQASTPEINFRQELNFPNLPNEKKGGRRTQKKKSKKQRRKQNRA
jgi:hypothetical protein